MCSLTSLSKNQRYYINIFKQNICQYITKKCYIINIVKKSKI